MVDGVTAMAESVLVDVVEEAAGRPCHPRLAMARHVWTYVADDEHAVADSGADGPEPVTAQSGRERDRHLF